MQKDQDALRLLVYQTNKLFKDNIQLINELITFILVFKIP